MALRDASVVARTGLTPTDFIGRLESLVWEAVSDRQDGIPDPLVVAGAIEARYGFKCGPDVGRLFRETVSRDPDAYADRLRKVAGDEAFRADLEEAAARIAKGEARETVEADLMAAATSRHSAGRRRGGFIRESLGAVIDDLEGSNALPVVPTGFLDLDKILGGLHGGDMVVVAARPSMGKTAFGVNLLRNAAEKGHTVGMVSGEQGREQIAQRLVAVVGDVSLARMRNRKLDDSDWSRLAPAFSRVKDMPFLVDDLPRPTIADCAAVARSWKYAHKVELLLVDYLQLVRASGEGFRLQIGEVAQGLKALARELCIPVVVLAQVKREVESRPLGDGMGRMPYMADIAESSIIEQVADQILTLYRPAVYSDCNRDEGEAWVNIAKNRHGPIGMTPLTWRAHSLRFENASRGER